MKIQIVLSTLIVLTLASCNNSPTQNNQKQETPKALEDKSYSLEIASKRDYDDLVESLYKELVDKTPELKQLEDRIDELTKTKYDSTELFDKYNAKNQSYYNAASGHIEQIKDSLLKDKIKVLLANSLATYNSSISRHRDLLKSIEAKNLTLNDPHTTLKITRTLPLIEKYQKNSLPAIKPLEGFSKQLDETIKCADTLSKK